MTGRQIVGVGLVAAALVAGGVTVAEAGTTDDPTVQVTSSIPSGDIKGAVRFNASAANPGPDSTGTLDWDVDGVRRSGADCPDSASCYAQWVVDAATMPGTHTIQAVYKLYDGRTATSPPLTVHFAPDTTVAGIQASSGVSNPAMWDIVVFIYHQGRAASGAPVTVTLTPAVGKPTTHAGTTDSDGSIRFTYPVKYNTAISVVGGDKDGWGRSTRSKNVKYTPTWKCSLSSATLKHGKPATISCTVPGLPAGTKVDVAYLVNKQWVTLNKGRSAAGKVKLTFTPTHKGKTYVRAESKGAHVFQDANGYLPAKVT